MASIIAAMDIGASKTHLALLTGNGKMIERWKVRTHEGSNTPTKRLRQLCASIREHARSSMRITSVGVAFAGRVNRASGRVLPGPNFKWGGDRIPLGSTISSALGVPCSVDNDVHCFTFAEATRGAGRNFNIVAGIAIGTGIGGGIAMHGELVQSTDNTNSEFGHMSIESGIALSQGGQWLPVCGDGFRGHWESLCSARAIEQWYRHFAGSLAKPKEVEILYAKRDPAAIATVNIVRHYIAQGLANIIIALNPDMIVLGGGLMRMRPLWVGLDNRVKQFLPYKVTCRMRFAQLEDDAQLIGAALLATQRLKKRKS